MNKKITLLIISCLLAITSVYSNDDFFYERDIFTVTKAKLESKNAAINSGSKQYLCL